MLNSRGFLLVIFLLAGLIATAQQKQNDYSREWQKIDSLIEKAGLPQSALKEVELIYSAAKKESNDVQLIKALVYRMIINDQLSEQGKYENIQAIEKEIASAKEPARSILSSIAGGSYWHYLQLNRWQFYQRTPQAAYRSDDIRTWDINQLYQRITKHYENSLQNRELLQNTSLANLNAIIISGNVRRLRPTLFDLLAHRALEYYSNDERYLTKPAYAFEISDSTAFAAPRLFAEHTFTSSDSLSLHHRAIEVFQQLTRFHLNDNDKSALVDADLHRLQFAHQFSTLSNKDELYQHALENIVQEYPNTAVTADAMYMLANLFMQKGGSYDPVRDSSQRYAILEAKKWCELALKQKDSSEGKSNAAQLLHTIIADDISVKTERVNLPWQPSRMLITYKNAATAYFKIIRAERGLKENIARLQWHDSLWQRLISYPSVQEFNYTLPATNDHQLHRAEAKINALPEGEYVLLVSSTKNFSLHQGALAANYLYISGISYLRNGETLYIVDRNTGQPLPAAKVTLWKEQYNYRRQRNELIRLGTFAPDKRGIVNLPVGRKRNEMVSYRFEIVHGKDRLFLDDRPDFYIPYDDRNAKKEFSYLFTDRSLYRPGQTVYFKGISVYRDNTKSNVLAGRKAAIELYDANGSKVDSIQVVTNEFGSYHGKFVLPEGMLNGQFRISDRAAESDIVFNVEEYKRPKFKVEVSQPEGTYRLNDTVAVTGEAVSYAGTPLNNASVKYRVVRRAIMPYWWSGHSTRSWPWIKSPEMEIVHGTLATDVNGKFEIRFAAIPDKSVDTAIKPHFHYHITAEVTDINGETRTGITQVTVGYDALKLNIDLPSLMKIDSLSKLVVTSTNMNDSFESVKVKLSVSKLAAPSKLWRQRYWDPADQFIMQKEEYEKLFPNDVYAQEDDMTTWAKEKEVFSKEATTQKGQEIIISNSNFVPGWYVFEARARDKFNNEVVARKFVQLIRDKLIAPFASLELQTADPGSKKTYEVLTNTGSSNIIIEENDTAVQVGIIKHNRIYTKYLSRPQEGDRDQLHIDFVSFRDKTLPGSTETWKVKIRGREKEKITSELLTAMYDASLDQFYPHQWQLPYPIVQPSYHNRFTGDGNFSLEESVHNYPDPPKYQPYTKIYDQLRAPDAGDGGGPITVRGRRAMVAADAIEGKVAGVQQSKVEAFNQELVEPAEGGDVTASENHPPAVQPRHNFNETAFFFPALYTDTAGNVEFTFTIPEALTTWKWMLLAHTKEASFVYDEEEIITHKQLMVQPNLPRFLREGDRMSVSARISNTSDRELRGNATILLIDPASGDTVDALFHNQSPTQFFSAAKGESVPVNFQLQIPYNFNKPVAIRIMGVANGQGGSLSDGEEMLLPVISNRMRVVETLPLPMRGEPQKKFSFDKLLNSGKSPSLVHQAITVEFTSNPVWFAVQALPYLSEIKDENAEQVFNRFYANALAAKIANHFPRIRQIIEQWKTSDSSAFLSNLQKNQELKSLVLQETPWVLEAKTEEEQKRNVALLFNTVMMAKEIRTAVVKLQQMQAESGGFVWFAGGPEDRYMTQYITSGIGKLKHLDAIPQQVSQQLSQVTSKALQYLDLQLKKDYDEWMRRKEKNSGASIEPIPVQYLYMRSFFTDRKIPANVTAAYNHYRDLATRYWIKQNTFLKGMIALALYRTGETQTAKKIMASLEEHAIKHTELGMYWKENAARYYWHQAPVETQSLMIEAFAEIEKDEQDINDMKTWLLRNKQTNSWHSSRATADACYALLWQSGKWIDQQTSVNIQLGNLSITPGVSQAGTGYFKVSIPADSITSAMGNISVSAKTQGATKQPSWGAVYWQYFEDLERITPAATPLVLKKELFIVRNTDRRPVLDTLRSNNSLKKGDKVRVRIEIRADRNLEYVHMKDMRAAGFEPVNVLSTYKWQGGLGYYESTRDASTNFFFNMLPKGVYIFEYDLFAAQVGTFSNGITSIQCMYAPEYSSHSEGIKVNIAQ